jgi:hypothetical protein
MLRQAIDTAVVLVNLVLAVVGARLLFALTLGYGRW